MHEAARHLPPALTDPLPDKASRRASLFHATLRSSAAGPMAVPTDPRYTMAARARGKAARRDPQQRRAPRGAKRAMSLVALPEPDRRDRGAARGDRRGPAPPRGRRRGDRRRGRPARLRDRRADRLPAAAAGRRAAAPRPRRSRACCATATSTASRSWRAAPAPRSRAARCRPRTRS